VDHARGSRPAHAQQGRDATAEARRDERAPAAWVSRERLNLDLDSGSRSGQIVADLEDVGSVTAIRFPGKKDLRGRYAGRTE